MKFSEWDQKCHICGRPLKLRPKPHRVWICGQEGTEWHQRKFRAWLAKNKRVHASKKALRGAND